VRARRPAPGPVGWRQVEQELQRARAARRLVPYAAGSALAAAALVGFVAGSPRAALAILAPGALLLLFVLAAAVPRCPECGRSLWRRGERPGPAGAPRPTEAERSRRCPRCGHAFVL
jgi:DNA-directed RNA polymerase subunit RPC12/RpoP